MSLVISRACSLPLRHAVVHRRADARGDTTGDARGVRRSVHDAGHTPGTGTGAFPCLGFAPVELEDWTATVTTT